MMRTMASQIEPMTVAEPGLFDIRAGVTLTVSMK